MSEKLNPIHPGEVLLEEFLKPMSLSQNRLAIDIGVDARRINEMGAFHLSYKVVRQPKVIVHNWRFHLRQAIGEQAGNLWIGLRGLAGWIQIGRINGVDVVPCDKHSMRPNHRFQPQRAGAANFQRLFEASACQRVQSGL